MKVKQVVERYGEEGDSRITVVLNTDGGSTRSLSFGEGEPEDMYLFRDLSDAYNMVEFARLAYEAGLAGECWEFEEEIEED